ncbi:MAG: hypothetical protein QOE55_5044 [Acidobacteriaceae bacterium]|jgi:hypothetical protein|nr:hypothetical protein [Acidobacteriaceae bacterium]
MAIWCGLVLVGLLLVIMIGMMLFYHPAEGGSPVDHSPQSAPVAH